MICIISNSLLGIKHSFVPSEDLASMRHVTLTQPMYLQQAKLLLYIKC